MTNGQQKIRVLIADDSPIVREGMKALLASQSDMTVVYLPQSTKLDWSDQQETNPDVVLYDFSPTISMSGISRKYPLAKIVVFTDKRSEEHIYQAIQAGARAYLDKKAPLNEIIDCIRTVNEGQTWIPQPIAELLARRMTSPQLTSREHQVLLQMAQGKNNKQIGMALGLRDGTVKVHMTHILGKLKVTGRLEALAAATSRGLISQVSSHDAQENAA